MKMSINLNINQIKVRKTRAAIKQSGSKEIAKEKRPSESSKCLIENKENTPPVFTRSKSRTHKSVNKDSESVPYLKVNNKQKKSEIKDKINRVPLKPVKTKPESKGSKICRLSLKLSPIRDPKVISKSGCEDVSSTLLLEESEDNSLPSISHIVFRRRSSNTIQKETCYLTSANPPLEYWKMLAEERLNAIEKTLYENELIYDQLSVLQAENSQLKEMVEQAKEVLQILQSIL